MSIWAKMKGAGMMLRLAVAFWVVLAGPVWAGKVALVIGNARYDNAASLPDAGNDAADLAARLEGLGFRVFAVQDLTRAGMLALLVEFSGALQPQDLALFYYAGHGVQIGAENYLIPVDAVASDEVALTAASVKLQVVMRTMELRADRRIVILDACRNNPFVEKLAARGVGEAPKGLARVEAGVGSFIAFSTQPANVALDEPVSAAQARGRSGDGVGVLRSGWRGAPYGRRRGAVQSYRGKERRAASVGGPLRGKLPAGCVSHAGRHAGR